MGIILKEQESRMIGSLIKNSCLDVVDSARAWRLWSKFAWHDMIARYRRSWIGPFWLVFTTAIFVTALSVVYSALFNMDLATYLPFITIGIVIWGFISSVISESGFTFVDAESYIRQVRMNLFVFAFRVIWRNILVFAHQFLVALIVVLFFRTTEVRMLPFAILGLFLLLMQALWVTPLLAVLGTRYRDLQPILANLLQVLFLVTPVIWSPALLGSRRWIADINPLTSLIAVVREPLLGSIPSVENYVVVMVVSLVGTITAMLVYGRFRYRIIFWL